ncbi:hypothetical protein MNBD_GAMMA03-1338 [hydrothermal vent metagenome]|uniref:Prepilin-type N-terminal cleavage/methylation domain-containing protein n=1 Tax=hydrothermal vent metagenome TaxID=652676 RepID=A0A3B0WTE8_9ZZZZ
MKNLIKQNGFTLVELAVVLGIVSVLAIGSATLFTEQKVNIGRESSEEKLKTVKVALLKFVEKNHYLPCPDTDALGDRSFGTENRFNETTNLDTCVASYGTVPFKMLGLSQLDVMDSYSNMLHYAVTGGVTSSADITDCPTNSACFFNHNTTPAFDHTTRPVFGDTGAKNLELCAGQSCSGSDLLARGLIAVILAYNQDGGETTDLNAEEVENKNNNLRFVKSPYLDENGHFFDDLVITISGNEIKRENERKYQKNSIEVDVNLKITGNDLKDMGDTRVGGVGTNVWTDDVIWDEAEQTFSFGEDAANKEIVLTYDTYAIGTWDQPGGSNSQNVTSDTATVSSNGDLVKEYKYEHKDNTQTGQIEVTYRDIANDPNGNSTITRTVDYWEDSTEVIVETDSEGKVKLEFAVGTTANYETIDFSNIELTYYNTPPPLPELPKINPISNITQTEGLQ